MSKIRHIILPDAGDGLLRYELAQAFSSLGYRVSLASPHSLHDPQSPQCLAELLRGDPALLFSVNFQGLGVLRHTVELLKRANCAAVVWCVDNPWNLLSSVRDPRWKSLSLFVTDASFIGPLKAHGAESVRHAPLAASPAYFGSNPVRDAAFPPPDGLAPYVFVGRSAFPGKEKFFAGLSLPEASLRRALDMLPRGERPDLAWWERELCSAPHAGGRAFWPGRAARPPAYGAEECNLAWRALCLSAAAGAGLRINARMPGGNSAGEEDGASLDIFGDEGWLPLLPENARLRPPVDYYARLPGIYARARYSLCLTSLQLPQGLNQRHFDIWMAGGVCLSDATPGLTIFPEELTRPMTFRTPEDIVRITNNLERPGVRETLIASWREHLLERHTYARRVSEIMDQAWCKRGPVTFSRGNALSTPKSR